MATQDPAERTAASRNITRRIQALGDWRGGTLAWVRWRIHEAVPGIEETWKWRGVPVWEHEGIICTGESYKQVVKLIFPRGASLDDPHGLFNAGLAGNARRAIDIREGEQLDAAAFKALIRTAAEANIAARAARRKK